MATTRKRIPAPVQANPAASAAGATTPDPHAAPALGDQPRQPMETLMTFTKENLEKAQAATMKSYDELTTFGKDNVDAVVKAGQIYVKGIEELSRALINLGQIQYEQGVAATKALMGCTSLRQVIDLQSDLAKTAVDKTLAEGSKMHEMALKVANEAMAPLQARVTLAVEKFGKPVAA
jgi:phasin family protein